jgi:phasin
MSNETKIPAELFQLSGENVRKAAEKGLSQTREAFDKFNATAKDAAGSLESSVGIVAKGLSEFNAKAFESIQSNAYLTLDFLSSLASVKSPTEAVSLQAAHTEKQIKALTDQAKDLSELAQKIAKESVEPLKGQFDKAVKAVKVA